MHFKNLNRRKFIKNSAIIAGGIHLLPMFHLQGNAKSVSSINASIWYKQPLRILQTVLREVDAKDYDAASVVNYMKKASCNTLVVNAGGIVDFFQNPLPAANINKFMGSRDILKEITSACKNEGFKVIGRIDFRGVEEHVFKEHPSWFSYDAQQKPVQLDYTRPQLYASCYSGYYRNEHAEEFISYLMKNYELDGIWHNSIGVGGICYCHRCQRLYSSTSGKSIPVAGEASEAELSQYMNWKSQIAEWHMNNMKQTVKKFGEDKVYTAEVFSMFEAGGKIHSGIDLYNARDHFDFLVSVAFLTENSEHIHYEDLNYAHTIIKFLKSMAPEKEAVILYGGNGTAHRYIKDPSIDLKVWLWQALSAGGRFWNCNFTGQHPDATLDRRNAYNNTEAYEFVKKHENILAQHVPVATIGIYYSRPTRLFYREKPPEEDRFDASIKGVEAVLMENHIPYDFIADDQLNSDRIKKYSLIILPNVRCLSDQEIAILKDYVQGGGNLLSTFATSLHLANGKERNNFGLAEVFGCSYSGKKVNTRKDNYQHIVKKHPILKDLQENTEMLINAGFTVLSKPAKEAEVICTLIPTVHNQPPEKAWLQDFPDEYPTLILNKFGMGTSIYFSNQPDQLSYEMGHSDMRDLLLNSIKFLSASSIPVQSTAPESVHIGLTQSLIFKDEYILYLTNTTSAPVRPLRNLIPVNNIKVELKLDGKSLSTHKVLRSQGALKVQNKGNKIVIAIEKLEDFSAIHFKMKT